MEEHSGEGTEGGGKRRKITLQDRLFIQGGLDRGQRIARIAASIGRTPQVVADEVKRNRTSDTSAFMAVETRNICRHKDVCTATDVCGIGCNHRYCYSCPEWKCNSACPSFSSEPCEALAASPFVCNACPALSAGRGCEHPHLVYDARIADKAAGERRSCSRRGVDMSLEEFLHAQAVVSDGLQKGQSPAHILTAHPELGFCVQTLYRHINEGVYGVTPVDLPESVRRRRKNAPKGCDGSGGAIPREALVGRTNRDWLALPEADRARTVEMDTVVGRRGIDRQCLLTLQWPELSLQLYPLLAERTAEEVVGVLDAIQDAIGLEEFRRCLGILKPDRGGEFADVERIEHDAQGNRRCRVFYCDARQSQQKPHAEREHRDLRRILPKGKTDFDALTREDMALVMSHVNSMPRPRLLQMAALDLALPALSCICDALGVVRIPMGDVVLNPMLIPHAMLPGTKPGRKVGYERTR